MKKRDLPSVLLFILLFIVFTAPGSVEFTPNANNIYYGNQEATGRVQSDDVWDPTFPELAGMAVTLTATKTDALFTDNNSNGEFDPGDVISYTIVIQNSGDMAENVLFDDTIDPNTTLVGGSLSVTPIARNDSYSATGNISITVPDGAGDALGNDSDPDGGALTVTEVQSSAGNVGSPTVTTATGLNSVMGSVTMQADGSFSYEPPPGFTGTDTFSYQVTDDEGHTDTATVSIVISDRVWFVDNSSGASNLGTFSNPFSSITSFNAAQGASAPNPTDSDVIFVYQGSGNYTDGINLRDSQTLLGQGIDLLTELGNLGITQSTFSDLASSPTSGAGNRPILTDGSGNGIALASGNTLMGLNVGNTSGIGVTGTSVGNLTIDEVGITGSGKAFDVDGGGTLTVDLDEVTVSSSSSGGFSLQNASGTTTLANVDITTTGGTGLLAGSAGTFTVTGSGNQINATSGTAVNIANTTIGSSDVTFESISASGGTNGIVLNGTGTLGGLKVTGTGATGSGGTIQNASSIGILLTSTQHVSLSSMNVQNAGDDGIRGQGVHNFELIGSNLTANGNATAENGLQFGEASGTIAGITGTLTITNTNITSSAGNNVHIRNTSGILTAMNVSGSTFNDLNDVTGANSFLFEMSGTAATTAASITGSTFSNNSPQRALEVQAHQSGTISNFTVSGSTFNENGIHASFTQDTNANLTFSMLNNVSMLNANPLHAINVFSSSTSTGGSIIGTIEGNVIGNAAVANSGARGNGIRALIQGRTTAILKIHNNTLRQIWDTSSGARGIDLQFLGPTAGGQPITQSDVTVTNNDVNTMAPASSFPTAAIYLAADDQGSPARVRANVTGNTAVNSVGGGSYDYPTFDGNGAHLIFVEVGGAAEGQLVDTAPASASATEQLTSTNTGTVFTQGISLIAGPINTLAAVLIPESDNLWTPLSPATLQYADRPHLSSENPLKSLSDQKVIRKENIVFANDNSFTGNQNTVGGEISLLLIEQLRNVANNPTRNTLIENNTPLLDASSYFQTTTKTAHVYLASTESLVWMSQIEAKELDRPRDERQTFLNKHKTAVDLPSAAFSGENINVLLGTLDPGQEVTIEFQATIDDPLPSGVDRVQNQGTVSGSNFSDVLTTDPDPNSGFPPAAGETITPLNVELDLTLTVAEGWRMLASPIDGLTYQVMLEDLWTQGIPTGADYDGGTPNVYTWPNDGTGTDPGNWAPLDDLNQLIPAGTGFTIFVFGDDEFGQDPPGEFPKTLTLSGTTHAGNIEPQMNSTTDGWTLVGNPYIAPIDFDLLTSSGLTGVAYVYDSNLTGVSDPGPTNGNDGGWRTTDGNFGDLTGGIIAAGQGFLVQNDGGGGSLTFTEAAKTTGGQLYGKQKELRDFVRLEVRGESGYNAVWIRFSGEGSEKQMYGDALELQPLSQQYALLGARKADGTLLDIAHFPLPDEDLEIPLAVEATLGGSYTITATRMDLPAGTGLYLHDLETGEAMPIDPSLEYSFTLRDSQKAASKEIPAVAGGPAKATMSGDNRFMITTSPEKPARELPEQVALGQNYPNPFNPTTVISYQLPVNSEVRLEVYDMLGRRVATLVDGQIAAGTHQVSFDASGLSSGTYVYRLQAGSTIMTKKLTVLK